jgi:aryl-alcohol dehydrogenase-like predicted oxidoreductase
VEQLERCEALGHVDSLQPPFSLIARDTAAGLLPWAAAHGTGVICYSPMKNGLLTDSFGAERLARMSHDDWRRSAPSFQEPALSRNLALRDALRPIAQRHGATVAAVAVAWVLAWRGVSGAIVGGRTPGQVDGWIGGARLTLSGADLDEITAAVEATGAGSGPADPRC